jgi:predicted phage terminase large subunit-like protein
MTIENMPPTNRQPIDNRLIENIRTSKEADHYRNLWYSAAREKFGNYRRLIRKDRIVWGWWSQEIADLLDQFYADLQAGLRPKIAIMAPPQHGKSDAVTDFATWVAGKNPDMKIIFGSFSDALGERTNNDVQRTITHPVYQQVFKRTKIGENGGICNNDLIEFCGYGGSFRNTTVAGSINGLALDLGIIDDPLKGRQEAQSKVSRDRIWDWFADDFLSRFDKDAGLICVMTRWHVDDLLGRALGEGEGAEALMPGLKVYRYPAIATHDEEHRRQGEALFPEWKPLDFLMSRKRLMSEASWESIYQQTPIVVGGGIFPIERLTTIPLWDRTRVKKSVRYIDKACTEGGGAYTAMVLMNQMDDGTFVISHIERGQWSALERERRIKACAEDDRSTYGGSAPYQIAVEQEPGSGGRESAESTLRMLAGFVCYADRVTGSKQVRADPFAAQVQAGNVRLVAGRWVQGFLEEAEYFPNSRYKDQIDAAAGAFMRLTSEPAYIIDSMI